MSAINAVIGNLTLLDLSLPGTHDSLTYDLSTTISDGGIDDYPELSKVLHLFSGSVDVIPGQIEDFIRQQARTQGMTITEQLDNGVRFVDFRTMKEKDDWYSLHMLQSNEKSVTYLKEIRDWLDAHPGEVVVLWMSKHGNGGAVGDEAYPGVSVNDKRAFWGQVEEVFSGLMLDTSVSKVNETTIDEMVSRGHRCVVYAGDYAEFTGSSRFALDGALVDNRLGSSVDDEEASYASEVDLFANAAASKREDKRSQKLLLRSMATSSPDFQIEAVAFMKFDPFASEDEQIKKCTDGFGIPSLNSWCPPTLMDVAQMGAYYKQITLDLAYNNFEEGWEFPNAIYLDSLDYDGRIRTGTTLPWGTVKEDDVEEHRLDNYPYADTLIGFNVKMACRMGGGDEGVCETLLDMIEGRRKAGGVISRWEDGKYGRSTDWPV
ncbi:hypothetical protein TrRE_jg2823 [Triparma retinervis]|uniref:PLC-like phosphodiesterase n=1 Tax=Triparma retinervis TaxID=2557542 RepID=A0A9W7E6Q1_9STRA|nr:hypothetical protein TrRE_jg2823 [Triparma retinervis]